MNALRSLLPCLSAAVVFLLGTAPDVCAQDPQLTQFYADVESKERKGDIAFGQSDLCQSAGEPQTV